MQVRNQKARAVSNEHIYLFLCYNENVSQSLQQEEINMFKTKNKPREIDESQLSHTKWNCMYHIVFIPKYRRKAIYGKLRRDIGVYLRRLCEYKDVDIVEAHACTDHIHMLVKIPPKLSVSQFMGYLKGKSALMIFENHANLKYKYGQKTFWARGYYVSTVGLNKQVIAKYIREQETEDMIQDKKSVKEYEDPFKGCQSVKGDWRMKKALM